MQKRFSINIIFLFMGILILSACSSSKQIVLKVEEHPTSVGSYPIHPPVYVNKITNIDDVGYKAKLFEYKGKLFIGNLDGEIYEINPKKEEKKEIIDLEVPIESAVFVDGDILFAGDDKGVLYKINYKKGKILKKKQFASPILRDIYEKDNKLYVITEDDTVTCLNPNDLSIIWSYSNGEASELSIRSTAGLLFLEEGICTGFSDGSVAKISYKGDQIWSTQVGNGNMFIDSDTTPRGNKVIFITSVNGYTEAVSSADGTVLWKRKISSYSNMQENIFGLFLADENGDVLALDNDNGETIWKKKLTNEGNIYSIYLSGNYVFSLTDKGNLVVLDAIRGKIMDIKDIDDDFSCSFTKSKNRLFVISRDGSIYSISSEK